MMDNILELVESCVDITEEIGNQINPDLGFDGRGRKGKWRAFKFENFKKSDYNRLNESLANYKTSLDLAVSLFSWFVYCYIHLFSRRWADCVQGRNHAALRGIQTVLREFQAGPRGIHTVV